MNNKKIVCSIGLFIGFSYFAKASEEVSLFDFSLEELMNYKISLPSKRQQSLTDSPAVTNVYLIEKLSSFSGGSVVDLLKTLPSTFVKMRHDGLFQVYIRGEGEFGNVLLMVDGQPLYDFYDGHSLFDLPIDLFSQVEVIRGPNSALYGSSASAGIINLVTKKDSTISAGVGQDNKGYVNFGWQEPLEQKFSLNLSLLASDGEREVVSRAPGSSSEISTLFGHTNRHLQQAIVQSEYVSSIYKFNALFLYREQGPWTGFTFNFGPNSVREEQHFSSALKVDITTEQNYQVVANFNIDFLDNKKLSEDFTSNSILFGHLFDRGAFTKEEYNGYQGHADVEIYYQLPNNKHLVAGVLTQIQHLSDYKLSRNYNLQSFDRQDAFTVEPNTLFNQNDKRRQLNAIFAQYQSPFFGGEWTIGARYDDYNDFGAAFSPKLVFDYPYSNKLKIKAFYGRAFRAPSFKELYDHTGVGVESVAGNETLEAETSDTAELSLIYSGNNIKLQANFFIMQNQKLIRTFDPQGGGGPATKENIGNIKTYGSDIELMFELTEAFRIESNLSIYERQFEWSNGVKFLQQQAYLAEKGDKTLFDTPRIIANVNGQFHSNNWQLLANINYLGTSSGNHRSAIERFSSAIPSLDTGEILRTGDSYSFNLYFSYLLGSNLVIKFAAVNLGSERYATPDDSNDVDVFGEKGLIQMQENFWLGVTYDF